MKKMSCLNTSPVRVTGVLWVALVVAALAVGVGSTAAEAAGPWCMSDDSCKQWAAAYADAHCSGTECDAAKAALVNAFFGPAAAKAAVAKADLKAETGFAPGTRFTAKAGTGPAGATGATGPTGSTAPVEGGVTNAQAAKAVSAELVAAFKAALSKCKVVGANIVCPDAASQAATIAARKAIEGACKGAKAPSPRECHKLAVGIPQANVVVADAVVTPPVVTPPPPPVDPTDPTDPTAGGNVDSTPVHPIFWMSLSGLILLILVGVFFLGRRILRRLAEKPVVRAPPHPLPDSTDEDEEEEVDDDLLALRDELSVALSRATDMEEELRGASEVLKRTEGALQRSEADLGILRGELATAKAAENALKAEVIVAQTERDSAKADVASADAARDMARQRADRAEDATRAKAREADEARWAESTAVAKATEEAARADKAEADVADAMAAVAEAQAFLSEEA